MAPSSSPASSHSKIAGGRNVLNGSHDRSQSTSALASALAFALAFAFAFAFSPVAVAEGAGQLPSGVHLSFTGFSRSSPINCSIDGSSEFVAAEICRLPATGTGPVTFSATSGTSARYQYRKKVQLWSAEHGAAASFSTSFVVEFQPTGSSLSSTALGGGWAFAITPDQRVGRSGPDSLGLFEINPTTGDSLRGKKKTKTLAIELDISPNSAASTFPDPGVPHVGLDVDSVRSTATSPLGSIATLVGRRIAVFVDYDATGPGRLDVRVQKLSGAATSRSVPDKRKAKLYISYSPLRLSNLVKEFSYVGFSTRVPVEDNARYVLRSWNFSTNWAHVASP